MPTKYVHFTDEQKEQARQTDLCELLRSQGETLKRSGTEYEVAHLEQFSYRFSAGILFRGTFSLCHNA